MRGVFAYEFEVSADAVDGNGHVNNVEYVRWMQEAAVRHSDATGCTAATREAGGTWVVRTHHVEYLRPAFAGDRIAVRTWVSNFRKVLSLRKYEFARAADGTVLARGETDWVFLEVATGRPRRVPEAVAACFDLVPDDGGPAE
ncbi:MAG TPA: acyl-CoA thioesterase [Gemmataceae bacterium]